jgi:hypothetical protein
MEFGAGKAVCNDAQKLQKIQHEVLRQRPSTENEGRCVALGGASLGSTELIN